jgi:hypothetical protein
MISLSLSLRYGVMGDAEAAMGVVAQVEADPLISIVSPARAKTLEEWRAARIR